MPRFLTALIAAIFLFCLELPCARAAENSRLAGNHPREAETAAITADADPAQALTMAVHFALRNRDELDKLLAEQQDPKSPNYHKWLATGEFDRRFGATKSQVDAVSAWLRGQGFTITSASPQAVEFTGTVAQAERAFSVRIAKFGNGKSYANLSDPYVPAEFQGVIGRIDGLDNMRHARPASTLHPVPVKPIPHPSARKSPQAKRTGPWLALATAPVQPDASVSGFNAFAPKDIWTFYDEAPLLNSGFNGSGSCVAIVGIGDFNNADVSTFDSDFGLPPSQITRKIVGTNPGLPQGSSDIEALLDVEYSHATAPGAQTFFYLGTDLVKVITAAVNTNLCGAISISFTICSSDNSFFSSTLDPIFSKAASQGQSVFVASGDQGAAGVVFDSNQQACVTANTRTVNEIAADPHVTAVGGTQFTPTYDSSGNDVGSVEEFVWNDGGGSTGGGASAVFTKPSYQSTGTPADGRRDVPDISLIASRDSPGVFFVDDAGIEQVGGTSLSAPLMAGFSQTLAQAAGGRLGTLNTRLYALANQNLAGNGFRDVTSGNNDFNGVTGFAATTGYDQASGWGTLDMATFANAFGKIAAGPLLTTPRNPRARNFGTHVVGKAYRPRRVFLFNPRRNHTTAFIQSVALQNGTVFQIDPNATTCAAGMSLAGGRTCVVGITFSPTTTGGPQTDTVVITDNSSNSPQQVPLTGLGK